MSDLKCLLECHLAALEDIQGLLARERECLLKGAANDISRLATDKQLALDRIKETAQGLEQLLAGEGAKTDKGGLAHCIEQAPNAGELSRLRSRIIDELRRCTELNQANGAVLEYNRAASERALRLLLPPQCDPDRYRVTGRLESTGSGQSIGKA